MNLVEKIERDGFAIVADVLDPETIARLTDEFLDDAHAARNLLARPYVQKLARGNAVRSLVASLLGSDCFAIRGTFFDKLPEANWKVPLHQDRMIPVRERSDAAGYCLWSLKEGVTFVQPPADVMQNILAVRIHLDDADESNGPLRVIPGSHRAGYISDAQLGDWQKRLQVTCICPKGSALLMRPLLLHASSPATKPRHRRVIHLEFAAAALPGNVRWHMQV